MNNITRRSSLIALSAILLAGCGSGNGGETAQSTADANTLRVGMECNYAPYNWSTTTETETSKQISEVDYCDGYDVMMATELAEKTDKEVEIVKLDWDNLILSLQNDQIDAVIAGMTATPERAEEVDFTTPYYISTEVVLVRKDSDLTNITSLEELSGRKVVGQMNTLYDTIIDQIPDVDHQPAAETFPAAVQALQAGAVDAVTSELPVANPQPGLSHMRSVYHLIAVFIMLLPPELLDDLQAALDTISDEDREAMMEQAVANQPANEE